MDEAADNPRAPPDQPYATGASAAANATFLQSPSAENTSEGSGLVQKPVAEDLPMTEGPEEGSCVPRDGENGSKGPAQVQEQVAEDTPMGENELQAATQLPGDRNHTGGGPGETGEHLGKSPFQPGAQDGEHGDAMSDSSSHSGMFVTQIFVPQDEDDDQNNEQNHAGEEDDGSDSEFHMDEDAILSDGEWPRKRSRPSGNAGATNQNQEPVTPASANQKKPRQPLPKTAEEYWKRRYAESAGPAQPSGRDDSNKRKRPAGAKGKGKKKSRETAAAESRLIGMLRESNPIVARAAMGAISMPGPIQAKTQTDQIKAMKQLLFKISSNPKSRSESVDVRVLQEAMRSFGHRKARAENGKWRLNGMKSSLYNHQLVGASWMLGQEFSPDGPFGGILADQMGLGKTVQVLAAMSANRPSYNDVREGRHMTLIVAPAVAIGQWIGEIKKHCDNKSFIRLVHHYRASHKLDPMMVKTADIIIASYNEVANAYPSEKALKEIAGKKLDDEDWAEEFDNHLGDLLRFEYFRVVLDEGHAIRNFDKKTAKACMSLRSKRRWILSGTPLHNSVDELYSYFRFLGAHWAEDREEFCKQFGNIQKDDVQDRLAAVVSSIMLRRRVDDLFLGVPILQIPKTHPPEIIWVALTEEERLIYRRLESRFRDNISTGIRDGTATKKMRAYVAFLTCLRQAVAHPYLLEGILAKNFTLEDFHYLKRQLAKFGGSKPMHQQVRHWVEMEYEQRRSGGETTTFGNSRFGYEFDMESQLEQVEAGKTMFDVVCRICYDNPTDPKITACGHAFCRECLLEAARTNVCCPACNGILDLGSVDSLEEPDAVPGEQSEDDEQPKRKRKKKKKDDDKPVVGDDANGVQPKLKDRSKWIKQYDEGFPDQVLVASAKTIAVKNQVLIWQREAPSDKIIIFVNWVKLGGIIGRCLHEEGIQFLYYFGDIRNEQKQKAITAFREVPEIKVLISSIRCGGQALNLTCANRVISVDQWWNTAMESQAFGRVHRIGQDKETHFVKILVKDTIDEYLLHMQAAKQGMIERALQEDAKHKTALTLDELVKLFGKDAAGVDGDGQAAVAPAAREEEEDDDVGGEAVESRGIDEDEQ